MDAFTGVSPSMESIVAGLAGFTLASLLSFARKPKVVTQESAPASLVATGGNPGSYVHLNSPPIHVPGMGHDFHLLARLVADKTQPLNTLTGTDGAQETMHQIFKNFQPQFAQFSSFEWRTNPSPPNYPNGSEIVGRVMHIMYAANAPSQCPRPSAQSSPALAFPGWPEISETRPDLVLAKHDEKWVGSIEETDLESVEGQRNQQRRKCCRRDKDDESHRSHQGWRRNRDGEGPSPGRWGWCAQREGYSDRWGWSRYREEGCK